MDYVRKLLRPQDILLLGLSQMFDVFEEMKDPFGILSRGYESMYGFVPRNYKRSNFNNLVWRSLKTGYIEKVVKNGEVYLRLTSGGKKRIQREFPLLSMRKKSWDRRWRIVMFDIKETNRSIRENLRNKLKELGFGMLQKSVFISPYDIVSDFIEFVESQGLSDAVYVLETSNILTGNVKELARKVWRLKELNDEYERIIEKIEELDLIRHSDRRKKFKDSKLENEEKRHQIIREIKKRYLEILMKDPLLPKELLPSYWQGDVVRALIRKL